MSQSFSQVVVGTNQHIQKSIMQTVSSAHNRTNRRDLDKTVPELELDVEPQPGEIISKNGVSFKHQKFQ